MKYKLSHNFHLVENSPWPIIVSINLLFLVLSGILAMNRVIGNQTIDILVLISLIVSVVYWLKDIIIESTYEGAHTKRVEKGLMLGFVLFVISEICLFSSLFFTYFYNSLIPSVEISSNYPPIGILAIDPQGLPLLNTIILFISGITSTMSLNYFISSSPSNNNKLLSVILLSFTIILGIFFSYFQYEEYFTSTFTIADSVFGSNLYLLSGFHGVHVIFGILLLTVTLVRIILNQFTKEHYLLFSCANLYWHFVDYVWIILFVFLYCWGS